MKLAIATKLHLERKLQEIGDRLDDTFETLPHYRQVAIEKAVAELSTLFDRYGERRTGERRLHA